MPPANTKLAVNVRVSVNKRFIKNKDALGVLKARHDWSQPGLSFLGKTVSCRSDASKKTFGVVLDDVPAVTLDLSAGSLKYLGPLDDGEPESEGVSEPVVSRENDASDQEDIDFLEDAEESDDEIDLTRRVLEEDQTDGWTWTETLVDARLAGIASDSQKARIALPNYRHAQPFEYFLYFLPLDHFTTIIDNTNENARSSNPGWTDITFEEYLLWIALLSVMVVVGHIDKKAYWKAGNSHFFLSIDFSEYMSMKRFNDIMRLHCFEVPSFARRSQDALYQIRSTLAEFNKHLATCLTPCKYLVIDETMNQWLGIGMPNLKKVPRKPHPIGQEFKTLADFHTNCILQLDTVSDDYPKEFDDEYGSRSIKATVKRLVKPWFHSGRTVIADSWFGGVEMVDMLMSHGIYSIMQVVKRRAWPRGMPRNPSIIDGLGTAFGSHKTAYTTTDNGNRVFACSYRDKKVKALLATCGTTSMTGKRVFYDNGRRVEIDRPAVFSEYEEHKRSVDIANNRRDNLTSYHDVIATERWEMRFLGFILGIAEANAFSCYKEFAEGGDKVLHGQFKDAMAFQLLKYCEGLSTKETDLDDASASGIRARRTKHALVSMMDKGNKKRRRLCCRSCIEKGKNGVRVSYRCSCNPDRAMCSDCHQQHVIQIALEIIQ